MSQGEMDSEGTSPSRRDMARFVEGLDFPVYVVTAASHEERSGCLVGFATQISLEPPRFLVCLSEKNRTNTVARASSHLGVHLLGPDEHALAELFGGETGDEVDKFSRCDWQEGPGGVPVLDGCPRAFVGHVLTKASTGDHTGFVLEPVWVASREGEPRLSFHDVDDVDPGHPA